MWRCGWLLYTLSLTSIPPAVPSSCCFLMFLPYLEGTSLTVFSSLVPEADVCACIGLRRAWKPVWTDQGPVWRSWSTVLRALPGTGCLVLYMYKTDALLSTDKCWYFNCIWQWDNVQIIKKLVFCFYLKYFRWHWKIVLLQTNTSIVYLSNERYLSFLIFRVSVWEFESLVDYRWLLLTWKGQSEVSGVSWPPWSSHPTNPPLFQESRSSQLSGF